MLSAENCGSQGVAIVYFNAGSSNNGTSSGGNLSDTTQGSGEGYNNDQNENPWAGYDHDVGLDYMKIGKESSDRWYESKVWPIDQIPDEQDFRVKTQKKRR